MKNTLKTICALILCAAAFACTDQLQDDAVKSVITADVTSINEVAANNPAEFPVSIKSNVNWIVETPEWVTPSTVFGHGDAIITFKFASNYKNETTTTKSRTTILTTCTTTSFTRRSQTAPSRPTTTPTAAYSVISRC